jgi:hypothetical protein
MLKEGWSHHYVGNDSITENSASVSDQIKEFFSEGHGFLQVIEVVTPTL